MSSNELVLLDQLIEQRCTDREGVALGSVFEELACELVMRDFDLTAEEARSGIVGGSNDGGLDGVFTLVSGTYISGDDPLLDSGADSGNLPHGFKLELVLVQAKHDTGFKEDVIDKASSSTRRMLDLAVPDGDLLDLYSQDVVEKIGRFRTLLTKYAFRRPSVRITFVYASRGDTRETNSKVEIKARDLAESFRNVISGAEGTTRLAGAVELWSLATTEPGYDLPMVCDEYATSGDSHVAIVSIRNYINFISDEKGGLRRQIFDANVRDYQGPGMAVNKEIAESAQKSDPDSEDFWWLNNGVTLLCSEATIASKTLHLADVQIVNGLQTSHTLHHAVASLGEDHPIWEKHILVRVLKTVDPEVRDAIIRATNSQTTVQAASLRATDKVQRDIESYFLGHGWFYDRRKNYYRNIGKPTDRILGISWLAQAVTAMGASQPSMARARPASLLKDDERYAQVFNPGVPVGTYLKVATAQHKLDKFLMTDAANVSGSERTNVRYHAAMLAAAASVGTEVRNIGQLSQLDEDFLSIQVMARAVIAARSALFSMARSTGKSFDSLAKGSDFTRELLQKALPIVCDAESSLVDCAWPWLSQDQQDLLESLSELIAVDDDLVGSLPLSTVSARQGSSDDEIVQLVDQIGILFPRGWLAVKSDSKESIVEMHRQLAVLLQAKKSTSHDEPLLEG